MARLRDAKKAAENLSHELLDFREFMGSGVVPCDKNKKNMVVAIYVSRPVGNLSKKFLKALPEEVILKSGSKMVVVETRVIDVGELSP